MPTSVLLAVLVAAGLLALAPALVRRYDATERLDAERLWSTARVLRRTRRRRTVPGRLPVNPPLAMADPGSATASAGGRSSARQSPFRERSPARSGPKPPRPRDPAKLRAWWRRRRRRVLGILVLLVAAEISGAILLGPGFLAGLLLSVLALLGYVAVLRNAVVVEHRRRLRRRWAELERELAAAARRRRLAEKRRRMAEARQYAQQLVRQRAAESEEPYLPPPGLRGESYEARAANF